MKAVFFIITLAFFFSCKGKKKENVTHEDAFYTSKGSYDAFRIPIIKPYELIKLKGTKEWMMNFSLTPSSASNIRGVALVDSIILIKSGETYCNYKLVNEAWFIVNLRKKTEKGFEFQEEFQGLINELRLPQVKFLAPDDLYRAFENGNTINW